MNRRRSWAVGMLVMRPRPRQAESGLRVARARHTYGNSMFDKVLVETWLSYSLVGNKPAVFFVCFLWSVCFLCFFCIGFFSFFSCIPWYELHNK